MDTRVAIYVLRDPDTNEVRYVGKSWNPKTRLAAHCSRHGRCGSTHRHRWLATLHGAGKRPTLEIIEWVKNSKWPAAERRHIRAFKTSGAKLTNTSDGGEGWPTGTEPRLRYLKRQLTLSYKGFMRRGNKTSALKIAIRLRGLWLRYPDTMPLSWATIGEEL